MPLRENPHFADFAAEAARARGACRAWEGVSFRSAELKFAREHDLLAGTGSFQAGGRWNAPGLLTAIYSSLRPGTAAEEAFGIAAGYGLAATEVAPRVIVGIEWKLGRVLDLTGANVPAWVALSEWMAEDFRAINRNGHETLAQAAGRAVFSAGIEAILVPSVPVPGGINLVAFKRQPSDALPARVLGRAELERYLR